MIVMEIEDCDQWLLDGDCTKCRRNKYCSEKRRAIVPTEVTDAETGEVTTVNSVEYVANCGAIKRKRKAEERERQKKLFEEIRKSAPNAKIMDGNTVIYDPTKDKNNETIEE